MHDSSKRIMGNFLQTLPKQKIKIIDIGSYSVCGSYKDLMNSEWEYIGLDMINGPNVDIVPKDIYDWKEIEEESFDVVISGQAFEHIPYPWKTIEQINKIVKKGGLICIIAPSSGREHKYPIDCYRYYPDGFRALAQWVNWNVLECYAERDINKYPLMNKQWQDCVLIAQKAN